MMQQQQHPPTPARRRANRRSMPSPAHKTYASENDVPTDLSFPIDFASPSPYTPQKPQKSQSNNTGQSAQQSNTKGRPRTANKVRPKNVSTSPGLPKQQQGRSTPPQTATLKAATGPAYAGATFHASPAPSSLPMPSFLARALDSPSLKDGSRASQEPSPPATDSEALTPKHRFATLEVAREESPLDIFFRADRAEKERARRASSANVLTEVLGPFSPPIQTQSPQEVRTAPNGGNSNRNRRPATQRNPSSGISFNELDGTPGQPMGPAFSTPYQDRIRAAAQSNNKQFPAVGRRPGLERQTSQSSQPLQQPQPQQQTQQTQQPEADLGGKLLKFLAGPQPQATENAASGAPERLTRGFTVPGVQQAPVSYSGPTRSTDSRPPEILSIEDSLRRMLNIDPGANFGAAPRT